MAGHERNPKDLQALLKFCLNATQAEDASGESSLDEMDPEKRDWLQRALNDMSVDVFKELAKCIQTLSNEAVVTNPDADIADQLEALECAEEWVGQIDMANNFHQLGGFSALSSCLTSPHEVLRAGTCNLIAELSQNNPYCQEKCISDGIFIRILELLASDDRRSVQVKALYAVSCISRDFHPAQDLLLSEGGLKALMQALSANDEKLEAKSCFLLASLLETSPEAPSHCAKMGFAQLFASLLMADHRIHHEHIARALSRLVTTNEDARREVLTLNVNFQDFLNHRITFLRGKEEFAEEQEHCTNLLTMLYSKVADEIER